MNCTQTFIEKLRCPDYNHVSRIQASLNSIPKYSQTFIMNQMINKPRMLRNQYSHQRCYTSTDELCQDTKQVSLTITQLRNLRTDSITPEKRRFVTPLKNRVKLSEKKRSKTYHINSLAKTALSYVSRQENRLKECSTTIDILQSTQQTQQNEILKTNTSQCELTFHSHVSLPKTSISLQIECVKLYVSEINNYNIKWEGSNKITKNIPKILHEKYVTSDNVSLYLESSRFKIEENFNQVYGHGKYRWLYPGEEAAIIESITQFLSNCEKKISLLMMSLNKIIKQIVAQNRLEYLLNYPICMKQIEAHWRIMATQFKQAKQYNLLKHQQWKDIQGSKTLFLDMSQGNVLVDFVKQNY